MIGFPFFYKRILTCKKIVFCSNELLNVQININYKFGHEYKNDYYLSIKTNTLLEMSKYVEQGFLRYIES